MKKTLIAAAILAVLAFGACKKEEKSCGNKANIAYSCTSLDLSTSYQIYLDSVYLRDMNSGDYAIYPVSTGWHYVYATWTNSSGAHIKADSVHSGDCETLTYQVQ
jgi:hypothetical protein